MSKIINILKEHIKDLIFAFLILGCLTITAYNFYLIFNQKQSEDNSFIALDTFDEEKEENVEDEPQLETPTSTLDVTPETLYYVDVKGAVKNPGVYQVKSDAIINDVITLAGGFKSTAYQDGINLSQKISDSMVIYVYTKSEITKNNNNNNSSKDYEPCPTIDYNICECVENQESIIVPEENVNNSLNPNVETESSSEPTTSKINLNTATLEQLITLNGIGESKAQLIIEYRNTNGNFKTIDDILNVKGIGEALFAKIKDYITV